MASNIEIIGEKLIKNYVVESVCGIIFASVPNLCRGTTKKLRNILRYFECRLTVRIATSQTQVRSITI
jgi:hypothetical protein